MSKNPALALKSNPTAARTSSSATLDEWDAIASGQKKRGPGRPRKSVPAVDWPEIERLLVHGESRMVDGKMETIYPTHVELARRFNVSRPDVTKFAQREKVMARRARAVLERQVTELAPEQPMRSDPGPPAELAVDRRERVIQICDLLIEQFYRQLVAGKLRIESVADLKIVVAIREQLVGGAEARTEQQTITLEVLVERHRDHRTRTGTAGIIDMGVVDEAVATGRGDLESLPAAQARWPEQRAAVVPLRPVDEDERDDRPAPVVDDIADGYVTTVAVCSATIAELGYDDDRGIMEVVHHDGRAFRHRVAREVYDQVAGATNPGRALEPVVRQYPGVQV